MIAALEVAVTNAEALLGHLLAADCVDPDTGEIEKLVVVTDSGPVMRSIAVARWFRARPWMVGSAQTLVDGGCAVMRLG